MVINDMMDTFWKKKPYITNFNKLSRCNLEYPLDPKYVSTYSYMNKNSGIVYENKTYTLDPFPTVQVEHSINDTMISKKEVNNHDYSTIQDSHPKLFESLPNVFVSSTSESSNENQIKMLQFEVDNLRKNNVMFSEMISHIYDTMITSDNSRLRSVISEVYGIMSYKNNDTSYLSSDSGRPQKRQLIQSSFNENIPIFD
jgi:hypothetical protein